MPSSAIAVIRGEGRANVNIGWDNRSTMELLGGTDQLH